MRHLYLPFIALLFCGCERVMVMDAGEKPQVVVSCVLTNDAVQTLKLSYSKGAGKEIQYVEEAEAVLTDLSDGSRHLFKKERSGIWTLNFKPALERRYRLEVNVPGHETITAEQSLPKLWVTAARTNCLMFEHHHTSDKVALSWRVYPEEKPYYLVIWAEYYDELSGERVMADYICSNGNPSDINVTDKLYEGEVYPELKGVRMHEKYLKEKVEDHESVIFVAGTFNGYFPYCFEKENSCFLKDGGILDNPGPEDGYLVFARPSDEYGRFMDEAEDWVRLQQSSDLSSIYVRENIYSNISGGIGFFGAMTKVKMMWSPDPTPPGSVTGGLS